MIESVYLFPVGTLVALKKCPPGFFLHDGKVGLKTSLHSMSGGIVMPDAYDVYGEYFWGGAVSPTERSNLRVLPLRVVIDHGVIGGDLHGRTELDHSEPSSAGPEPVSEAPLTDSSPSVPSPRRGRPKRTEPYPWEAEGVSKSTWMRRRKAKGS